MSFRIWEHHVFVESAFFMCLVSLLRMGIDRRGVGVGFERYSFGLCLFIVQSLSREEVLHVLGTRAGRLWLEDACGHVTVAPCGYHRTHLHHLGIRKRMVCNVDLVLVGRFFL